MTRVDPKSASFTENIMKTLIYVLIASCCLGCATVTGLFGQSGSILVTYYAPARGPGTNGEEVVYFLKQVEFASGSEQRTRIYFCSIKPDGTDRKEIIWLWKDQPDQFLENYPTAATMDINAATKRAAIGIEQGQRGGLFVVNLDGSGFHPLWPREWNEDRPTKAGYPTWSPDGQWIAFHEYRFENGFNYYRIAKFQPDSTGYTPLTERNAENMQPAWSPKGDLIAYVNDRIANPARNIHAVDLWLMGSHGGDKRDTKQWGRYPRWSPDGKFILHSGILLVDASSGKRVNASQKFPPVFPKWARSGFLEVLPEGINFTPPNGEGTRPLLKNVSRRSRSSDLENGGSRW